MRILAVVPALVLLACGGDDGDGGGSRPPPGPSADGWQRGFVDGSVAASCGSSDEADFAALPHVTVAGATLYAGYVQRGDNQDPVVARFDGGARVWCVEHETQAPDARATGLTWDGGEVAYVVYTVVGGGTALEGKGGWFPSYAGSGISGGGPKVTYLGRVQVRDGALDRGTFVIAVTSDRKVNSHTPDDAPTVLADGTVELLGSSAHKPIDADGRQAMACTDYPFSTRYRFSADLASLVCADSTSCTAQRPCP